jgi:hypothetical protein
MLRARPSVIETKTGSQKMKRSFAGMTVGQLGYLPGEIYCGSKRETTKNATRIEILVTGVPAIRLRFIFPSLGIQEEPGGPINKAAKSVWR